MKNIAFAMTLIALTSFALPATAQDQPSNGMNLSAQDQAAVRCSAAFAIIATEQQKGVQSAMGYPPMAWRGRAYFVNTGAQLMERYALTRDQLRSLMEGAATALQGAAAQAGNPDATIAAVMPPCLTLLDASVPALTQPELVQCASLMALAAQELETAEGLTPAAMDLKTLATVLEARARRDLAAKGHSGGQSDAILTQSFEEMAKLAGDELGAESYDIQQCFVLAQPEADPHKRPQ